MSGQHRKLIEDTKKAVAYALRRKDDAEPEKREPTPSTMELSKKTPEPGNNVRNSTDKAEYQRRIEELGQRNMELEQKNAELEEEVKDQANMLQEFQWKIQKLEQRNKTLEEEIQKQKSRYEGPQWKIIELEQRNKELEKKIHQQTSKHKGCKGKIKELEQRNLKLEEKLQEQQNIKKHTPGLLSYKINSRPRGLCVIINNLNFYKSSDNRYGAQFDERRLKDLFNELSFDVSVLNDLSRDEIPKVTADFAAKDHTHFDVFVFVVLSHGGERDVIYGVDGRTTRIEDLMSEFKAPNCPTLRNKPKLFFIQTCRGSEREICSFTSDNYDSCMDAFCPDSTLPRSVCPQEADFLLAFATVPGYVSWRNQQSGTWFVQTLVEVIRKRHFHDHLLDMLTEVNRLVVERGQTAAGRYQPVQVPAPVHTLRAKLYL